MGFFLFLASSCIHDCFTAVLWLVGAFWERIFQFVQLSHCAYTIATKNARKNKHSFHWPRGLVNLTGYIGLTPYLVPIEAYWFLGLSKFMLSLLRWKCTAQALRIAVTALSIGELLVDWSLRDSLILLWCGWYLTRTYSEACNVWYLFCIWLVVFGLWSLNSSLCVGLQRRYICVQFPDFTGVPTWGTKGEMQDQGKFSLENVLVRVW